MKIKFLTISLALLLIGCSSGDDAQPQPAPAPNPPPAPQPAPSPTGLLLDKTVAVAGSDRDYHLYAPQNQSNSPLIIVLHGNDSDFDAVIGRASNSAPHSVWLTIAENNNAFVAVPNGGLDLLDRRGWNDCRDDVTIDVNRNDVLFISNLIDDVSNEFGIDENRVYVAGTSNGGHMAIRLALEIPEKIAAFASIIASMDENSQCAPLNLPVSALFMNGTEDPVLPYEGGEIGFDRGVAVSTAESVNYWKTLNTTVNEAVVEELPNISDAGDSIVTKFTYPNGIDGTEVVLYEVENGGHAEPSIQERYDSDYTFLAGNQNADLEMAEAVWEFFQDKSK